jgi:glutamate-1-semialdehyde 2,1-aminomutase
MMARKIIAIVQARQGSSRLPGKSLRPLAGRPLIAHVLERAAAIPGIDSVMLATSTAGRDDALASTVAQLRRYSVVRGSEHDVLDRIHLAASLARADVVMRLTGDCPLLAPEVAEGVCLLYALGFDYAWNDTRCSGFPDGTDVEVFSMELLAQAAASATRAEDREHVTPWIRRVVSQVGMLPHRPDLSWLKLSVDTPQDFAFVQRVASYLPGARAWSLDETVTAVDRAHGSREDDAHDDFHA